jgi:phenylpropionate dioxygenase-like ring-hydroxylating dioxygenase large terminal subunit
MTLIDPALSESLAAGYTLPADWYTAPEIARLERERIFGRSWQYVGPLEHLNSPQRRLNADLGDRRVVVMRQADGSLRAGVGDAHGPVVAVDALGPLVFANPDPGCAPLAEWCGDIEQRLAAGGVELGAVRFRRRVRWGNPVNWKNGIENYLECYHCPVAHPGLSKLLDTSFDGYELSASGHIASQYGHARGGAERADLPYRPKPGLDRAQYHLLWPNTTFNAELGPLNLDVDSWLPDGPGAMHAFSDYYAGEDTSDEDLAEIMAFGAEVNDEDRGLVRSVQAGLESGMVPQGRLLTNSEFLIGHFQRLVYRALAD